MQRTTARSPICEFRFSPCSQAAQKSLRQRKPLRRRAAGKPVIHSSRSGNDELKAQVADRTAGQRYCPVLPLPAQIRHWTRCRQGPECGQGGRGVSATVDRFGRNLRCNHMDRSSPAKDGPNSSFGNRLKCVPVLTADSIRSHRKVLGPCLRSSNATTYQIGYFSKR